MSSSFERHGLDHLSASSINLFVAKAMCQYSNSTTKNMCSVGRMAIPKQEIVDGCIAARGWKQEWAKASS